MDKRMKMKVLDYTLICLLAGGMAPLASAQEASPEATAAPATPPVDCGAEACKGEDGLLFQLRTRSYGEPVTRGADAHSSSTVLQPDRRIRNGRKDRAGVEVAQLVDR